MQYVKSFSSVSREDYATVGYVAADLALAYEKQYKIPLSFLLTSDAYHLFLSKNGLKNKLLQLYHNINHEDVNALTQCYLEIKKIFLAAEIPEEILEEVNESYHSLGGSITDTSAEGIISQQPNPRIMVMKSPNYVMEEDDLSGVLLNVKGEEFLHKAIKLSWASLFSPKSAKYRLDNGVSFPDNCGLIVQRFFVRGRQATAIAYNREVKVNAYLGILDVHEEFNKDEFVVDREYLQIKESNINYQDYFIGLSDENLIRINLKDKGSEQKLNDKEVMEVARTAKRLSLLISKNVIVHLLLKNDKWFIVSIHRRTSPEPVETTPIPQEEEKMVQQIREQESDFAEQPIGESSETEIDVEVDEPVFNYDEQKSVEPQPEVTEFDEPKVEVYESEQKNMAFDTYDTEEKPEIYSETETTNSFEEPESSSENEDTQIVPEETVFPETEMPSPKPEMVQADDDFILPVDEPAVDEEDVDISDFMSEASSMVDKAYRYVGKLAMKKYHQMYGDSAESLMEAIADLQNRGLLNSEVSRLMTLKDKYDKGNDLSPEELVFVVKIIPDVAAKLK